MDVADGGTIRIVLPADEDDPTVAIAVASEDELPTVRLSTDVIREIESGEAELDLPTIKIAAKPVRGSVESEVEVTVDLTRDALPDELLRTALPFLPVIAMPGVAPEPPVATPPVIIEPAPIAPLSKKSLDIAGVAAIAAELADKPPTVVLSRHDISDASWAKAERAAIAKVAAAIELGDRSLRDAFDDAYLEARTARRGSFGRESLARLRADALSDSTDDAVNEGIILDIADAVRFRRVLARR